jgi:hypothetical protein
VDQALGPVLDALARLPLDLVGGDGAILVHIEPREVRLSPGQHLLEGDGTVIVRIQPLERGRSMSAPTEPAAVFAEHHGAAEPVPLMPDRRDRRRPTGCQQHAGQDHNRSLLHRSTPRTQLNSPGSGSRTKPTSVSVADWSGDDRVE